MTQVFVVNSGSSSIKYQVMDVESEHSLLSGIIDRIGEPGGEAATHAEAMQAVLAKLATDHAIAAVGHRVVHGGDRFSAATVIDDDVEQQIEQLAPLAPLHNPANLAGIQAARRVLPDIPHVAVFDTAFHQSLAPEVYTYAIDAELAKRHGIRRYGFHGTSHEYVAEQAARMLGRPVAGLRIIVFHLGNGASVCAIDGGRSVETSMGMTPLEGLVMGTRSGDLDPAVLFYLSREAGLSVDDLDDLLNRKSGLLGLTGTGDLRDVQAAAASGDPAAITALDVYVHRIRHYLGAYLVHLGGADAIVFTAGVGENSPIVRARALEGLGWLGIEVDAALNDSADRGARRISSAASVIQVLVLPTNEELEIARQTLAAV